MHRKILQILNLFDNKYMEYYNGNDDKVSLNNKTLIFIANWMGILSEITEKIDRKDENNKIIYIDTDKYPKLTAFFEVNLLPTVIILDNDVESTRHVGYIPLFE